MKKYRTIIRSIIEFFPLLVLIFSVFRSGTIDINVQLEYLNNFKFVPFYDLLVEGFNVFNIELTVGVQFLFIMLSWLLMCMIFELIYLFFEFLCNIFERKGCKM